MAETLRIKIKTLDNQITEISVPKDILGLELKKIVNDLVNIEVDSQKLIYKGKQITNTQKLSEHVTQNDETIHVLGGRPKQKEEVDNTINQASVQPSSQSQKGFSQPSSSQQRQNQPPKLDLGSIMNSMMQNPAIMQMAEQMATQLTSGQGSAGGNNSMAGLMNLMGGGNLGSGQIQTNQKEEEKKNEPSHKKSLSLPFQNLQNLSAIADSLMGENSNFPGPGRPILGKFKLTQDYDRNNLTILGGYVNKLYFNLLRILPFLGRLGDLMERESLLKGESERKELEKLSHNVSIALTELQKSVQPLPNLLENIKIGSKPGESHIIDKESGGKIEENRPSSDNSKTLMTSNKPSQSGQKKPQLDINSMMNEMMKPENMKNIMGMMGGLMGEGGEEPDLGGMMGMLGPMMSQLGGGNKSGGGMMDMMSMLVIKLFIQMGGKQAKKTNNNSTLREILAEMIDEEPESDNELLELLMDLTMNEIIQLTNGNFSSVYKMRKGFNKIISNNNLSVKEIALLYGKYHCSTLKLTESLRSHLSERFDLIVIVQDLMIKHYQNFINLFKDSGLSDNDFSNRFKLYFTLFVGETVSTLIEGFKNNKNAVVEFVRVNLENSVVNTFEEMSYVLKTIGGVKNLSKLIFDTHAIYLKDKENLLKEENETKPKVEISWEDILKFAEIDEKRQEELNRNLIGKIDENKETFSDAYRATYVYK